MKRPTHTVAGLILRTLATVVVLYSFAQAFLALRVLNTHNRGAESYAATKHMRELERDRDRKASGRSRPTVKTPWPKYPGAVRHISNPGSLNGIRVVTEEMLVRARPEDALGYFRRVMQSRGWEDFTEEYFGIRPDTVDCSGSYRNLQDEDFIQRYDAVMRTHACFRLGGESVMVRASEGQGPENGRYRVSLSHFGTDSLAAIAENISRRLARAQKSSQPTSILRSEQQWGADRFSSDVLSSALSVKRFSAQMNRQMRSRGWSEVPMDAKLAASMPADAPLVTSFAKGERMAMVTIAPGLDGKGSSGMLTEIVAGKD